MSDHWEFFPCQLGADKAFICYDHGISERLDDLNLPYCARLSVPFLSPDASGLPGNDESEALSELEDRLSDAIERLEGEYVGRISVGGRRIFYGFFAHADPGIQPVAAEIASRLRYSSEITVSHDPEKAGYWTDLFPTDVDWQLIADLKVIEQLEEHGDTTDTARKIDHLVYFEDAGPIEPFRSWLTQEGFDIGEVKPPATPEEPYGIEFSHFGTPAFGDVNLYTFKVFTKAKEMGGQYDGWGTTVET